MNTLKIFMSIASFIASKQDHDDDDADDDEGAPNNAHYN